MRNQVRYILTGLMSLGMLLGACKEDFLEQIPETGLTGANFFKNESDIKQGVNGAYRSLRDMGLFSYWVFGEMRSDNTTFQYNPPQRGQENREFVDVFLLNSANTLIQDYWRENYSGIARCNDIIAYAPAVAMSEEARNQAIGEVKFLRAFHYFNLVRQFGGVPLRLTVTETPADAQSAGRASVQEVYSQIIADLTDAAAKLPPSYGASDKGRATKGAALALLGKVYLTQKNYGEALNALRQVTTLGYRILPSYENVFSPQNKNNEESVFEIQYLGSVPDLASNFIYQFAPFNSGSVVTGDRNTTLSYNSGWNIPTQDLIDAYEPGDLRKDVSLKEGFTLPEDGFVGVPYINKYNHGIVDIGSTDDNFPVLRYADVLLMIAECLNEQGFVANGEAFNLLNEIRTRAGLQPKTAGNANAALSVDNQEEFRDAILQERRVELAFENQRWYDLVRTGRAVAVMTAHGREEILKQPIPANSYIVTENNLLLPIPQREVNLDNLEQNPM